MTTTNTPESFWARVDIQQRGCWPWTGATDESGYGVLAYQGRHVLAHRLSYELTEEPIPDGLYVCHSCDNRRCVRPDHLWLGTYADNMADALDKRRVRRGADHGNARLRPAAVVLIRILAEKGVAGTIIARRFGVSPNTVYGITSGRNWGWLS